ncbi:MAG: hypothetical protein Q9178_004888 [Gyalolechia marmorata]
MARPQQSPRMRDHWRDEGNRGEDTNRSGRPRERSTGRRRSPAASRRPERERSIDVEVKIRGRATIEEARRLPSHKDNTGHNRDLDPHPRRRLSQSPQHQTQRERSHNRYDELNKDQYRQRSQHRESQRKYLDPHGRRRSRTRSPHRAPHRHRDRQRSPDPYHPRHTDRLEDSRARYRDTRPSRPSSPSGADYYKPVREESATPAGDFYIPSARRRRSRSPGLKDYRDTAPPRSNRSRDARSSYAEDDLFYHHRPRGKIFQNIPHKGLSGPISRTIRSTTKEAKTIPVTSGKRTSQD